MQLLLAPKHGLGPQCPLLAPKSSVDPLTHWSSTFTRKKQDSEKLCEWTVKKYLIFIIIYWDKLTQTKYSVKPCVFMYSYCSLSFFHPHLLFFSVFYCLLPLLFSIFQVQWYIEKWGKVVWWKEIIVNSRGEVYVYSHPASFLTHSTTRTVAAHWS